jgi:hypothetical protein
MTLTLPITQQGGMVLLLAFAIAAFSALFWLVLPPSDTASKSNDTPTRLLTALAWVLTPIWLVLLAGTLFALWQGFNGTPSLGGSSGGSLGLGAVIVAILSAPFVIWTTVLKHRALGFQKEGHLTDRISKAVEQLGAEKTVKEAGVETTKPNIEVRIGGILSLERIAQDSCAYDKGRDHVRVMEILCAYVRENARAESLEPSTPPFNTKVLRIDIQTALDVIKRRSSIQRQLEATARYRLDLRATDLSGCDLSQGNLAGAKFWRSRLEATNFNNCDLSGAQMQECLLNFAKFRQATLKGTNMDWCVIRLHEGSFGSTIIRAKELAVSVVGADLSGISHMGRKAINTFGNLDTKLSLSQEEVRDNLLALRADLFDAERNQDAAKIPQLETQIANHPMAYWSELDSSDLALGEDRKEFNERHGLTGWPYED